MNFSLLRVPRTSRLFAIILCLFVFAGHGWAAAAAHHGTQASQSHASGQAGGAKAGDAKRAGKAAGNGTSSSGNAEGILVAEVVLLLLVGRLLGEVMQRFGQPALMGQLLAGIVLGPSLFGWIWPEAQKFIFPSDPHKKA
jgi:hypothetical protein